MTLARARVVAPEDALWSTHLAWMRDALWNTHLAWLRESTGQRIRAGRGSARRSLSPIQRYLLIGSGATLLTGGVLAPLPTAIALIALLTAVYLVALAFRLIVFWRGVCAPSVLFVSDVAARALPAASLPVYTVLVAAYKEPEVIDRLISSLAALEYPADRLDVKILLEADDAPTLAAARAALPPAHMQIVAVPVSEPRTKPKALNYGVRNARGKFLTIYDAEDRPEPLQLRRAVSAFRQIPDEVGCIQAKLSYHNVSQNVITRWFTGEYAVWFENLLPGLASLDLPLPLGGTSNHFRMDALERVGGWDAYNVTEDADLGIRLYRAGYSVKVLESTTLEEANSDFINWEKQRSRWYKGYLQTWLVHMREPRRLWSDLGARGFFFFNLFIGGTPLLTLLNPVFWALSWLWLLGRWSVIAQLFPPWLYYAAVLSLVLGNLSVLYMGVVSARATGRPALVPVMLLAPVYWGMMSLAAIKAFVQLLYAPTFWEKTTHGLDRPAAV